MISGDWAGHVVLFQRLDDGCFAAGTTVRHEDGTEVAVKCPSAAFAADWDGDNRTDLVVGDGHGGVFLCRSLGELRFGPPQPLLAGERPIVVPGDAGPAVADWDQDGRVDLIVGSGSGDVFWFRNEGTAHPPKLGTKQLLVPAPEYRADRSASQRTKVCVADWNSDGRLDLLVGDFHSMGTASPTLPPAEAAALRGESNKLAAQLPDLHAAKRGESQAALEGRILQRAALVSRWAAVDLKLSQNGTRYAGHVWVYLRKPNKSDTR